MTHPFTFDVKPTMFNDEYRKVFTDIPQFFSDCRSKEILLLKNWSNNVTVANQYAESAIPH